MSKDWVLPVLLLVAGFLLGGVYSTWKTNRTMSYVLAVATVLALGGVAAWYFS